MARISKGRRKIAMKKIESETNLQVTFSKRRTGVFKKASELCTLTGAEVAIVVISPGNKAYSFGHPSVESIVHRYLTRSHTSAPTRQELFENAHLEAKLNALNEELSTLHEVLDHERRKRKELDERERIMQSFHWWERPMDQMSAEQQMWLKTELQKLLCMLAQEKENSKTSLVEAFKILMRDRMNPNANQSFI